MKKERHTPIIPVFFPRGMALPQYSIIPCIAILLILLSSDIYSQSVYKIPFGSKGNIIELSIANETEEKLQEVRVEIATKPEWIKIEEMQNEIEEIASKGEALALIKFSIDKKADINKEEEIKLEISNDKGIIEEKIIKIEVEAPKEYKLEQNYPNPFNPITRIGYQIPEEGRVQIKVYDILGREIKTLVEENKKAGYYEAEFDGSNLSSGIYVYRLMANKANQNKKMILIK
ncbi:MAG: T9SS type A sorting domain-containing protein [Melioribacteraceae bacterium]